MRYKLTCLLSISVIVFIFILRSNPLLFSSSRFSSLNQEIFWPVYLRSSAIVPEPNAKVQASKFFGGSYHSETLISDDFSFSEVGNRKIVAVTRKGKIVWELHLPPRTDEFPIGFERVGNILCVIDVDRSLYVLDARQGDIFWMHFTGQTFLRPHVVNNSFYYIKKNFRAPTPFLIKLDLLTGKVLWRTPVSQDGLMMEITEKDGTTFLRTSRKIFKFNAQTGNLLTGS